MVVDWLSLLDPLSFSLSLVFVFSLPFCFWLVSKALFDDQFKLRRWMLYVWIGVVALTYALYYFNHYGPVQLTGANLVVLQLVQHLLSLLFIGLAIAEAARNRSADLLLSRYRFRTVFIVLAGLLIVMTVMVEIAYPGPEKPVQLEFLQKLFIAGLTFYFTINRLELKSGFLRPSPEKEKEPVKQAPVDNRMIELLLSLMEKDKFYHREGLTISQLASTMNIKEYKLRQAINQQLGFRNFNEFLNSYRLQEACDILADPENKEMTILEIAFQLGYNSLAPFNKAFKQSTGMTPTQWRKEKID